MSNFSKFIRCVVATSLLVFGLMAMPAIALIATVGAVDADIIINDLHPISRNWHIANGWSDELLSPSKDCWSTVQYVDQFHCHPRPWIGNGG